MDKKFHPTLSWACDYISMLRLKLKHVSKGGPWTPPSIHHWLYIPINPGMCWCRLTSWRVSVWHGLGRKFLSLAGSTVAGAILLVM